MSNPGILVPLENSQLFVEIMRGRNITVVGIIDPGLFKTIGELFPFHDCIIIDEDARRSQFKFKLDEVKKEAEKKVILSWNLSWWKLELLSNYDVHYVVSIPEIEPDHLEFCLSSSSQPAVYHLSSRTWHARWTDTESLETAERLIELAEDDPEFFRAELFRITEKVRGIANRMDLGSFSPHAFIRISQERDPSMRQFLYEFVLGMVRGGEDSLVELSQVKTQRVGSETKVEGSRNHRTEPTMPIPADPKGLFVDSVNNEKFRETFHRLYKRYAEDPLTGCMKLLEQSEDAQGFGTSLLHHFIQEWVAMGNDPGSLLDEEFIAIFVKNQFATRESVIAEIQLSKGTSERTGYIPSKERDEPENRTNAHEQKNHDSLTAKGADWPGSSTPSNDEDVVGKEVSPYSEIEVKVQGILLDDIHNFKELITYLLRIDGRPVDQRRVTSILRAEILRRKGKKKELLDVITKLIETMSGGEPTAMIG